MKTRESILPDLLAELERTRTRRVRVRRTGGALAAVAIVAGAAMLASLPRGPKSAAPASPAGSIPIVRTDPTTLERWATDQRTPALTEVVSASDVALARIEFLDDDGLARALAAAGRPTGIARSDGRAWTLAAVTDEELRGS